VALICDTSTIFAAIDRRDQDHERCRRLIDSVTEQLIIPAPVLVELDYWINKYLSFGIMARFLDDILNGAYLVEDLVPRDYLRIRELCERYESANIGFVDAAVVAVVERLNEPKLATLDHRHFGLIRPRHVDVLLLLPDG
jgi:uncharacterized protein